ncbi:methyl-accepting chemotaxis protein [Kineococcus gynurae]|uniref:Methyl-accepting chemotaxis protein n=1 Tax=Kineococcus gynurae TaxID=452979 RepID=A0ABV5LTZ2_9ACTN
MTSRLGLRTKILGLAAVLAAVSVIVGLTGVLGIARLRADLQATARSDAYPARALAEAQRWFEESRQHVVVAATTTDVGTRRSELDQASAADELVRGALDDFSGGGTHPLPPDVSGALDRYTAAVDALRDAGSMDTIVYNTQVRPAADELAGRLQAEREALVTATTDRMTAAETTADQAIVVVVVVGIVGLLGGSAFAWVVAARSVRRMRRLRDGLAALAVGDLTVRVDVDSADEIGQATGDLEVARAGLRRLLDAVAASAGAVGQAGTLVRETTGSIAGAAGTTSTRAVAATTSAEAVSLALQSLARSAEELGDSITDISSGTAEVTRVAGQAVDLVADTNRTVSELGESSAEIGDVIRAITAIAEQTNLLALNATIEAARAGAAGRGFAVVAGEVKELSVQTARATEDIGRRVQRIQDDAMRAAVAIDEIGEVITGIATEQHRIASSIAQQSATTELVTHDISAAAEGGRQIAAHVSTVADSAVRTTEDLRRSREAVEALTFRSQELTLEVARFKR